MCVLDIATMSIFDGEQEHLHSLQGDDLQLVAILEVYSRDFSCGNGMGS